MAKPQRDLKSRNLKGLFGLVLANAAIFYLLAGSADLSLAGLKEALSDLKSLLAAAGVGALATTTISSGLIPTPLKERLVFWRWRDYLPSNRAFSDYGPADPRVDMAALEKRLGELPTAPAEQSKLWYRLFKECDSRSEISQAHQSYLFAREYTAISFEFLALAGSLGLFLIPETERFLAYIAALLVQYVLAGISARHHGIRMVVNTLALQSVGNGHPKAGQAKTQPRSASREEHAQRGANRSQ